MSHGGGGGDGKVPKICHVLIEWPLKAHLHKRRVATSGLCMSYVLQCILENGICRPTRLSLRFRDFNTF